MDLALWGGEGQLDRHLGVAVAMRRMLMVSSWFPSWSGGTPPANRLYVEPAEVDRDGEPTTLFERGVVSPDHELGVFAGQDR